MATSLRRLHRFRRRVVEASRRGAEVEVEVSRIVYSSIKHRDRPSTDCFATLSQDTTRLLQPSTSRFLHSPPSAPWTSGHPLAIYARAKQDKQTMLQQPEQRQQGSQCPREPLRSQTSPHLHLQQHQRLHWRRPSCGSRRRSRGRSRARPSTPAAASRGAPTARARTRARSRG